MEKEENKSGSVYVTVDGYFNPIHISMKGKGKEGFWDFQGYMLGYIILQT